MKVKIYVAFRHDLEINYYLSSECKFYKTQPLKYSPKSVERISVKLTQIKKW